MGRTRLAVHTTATKDTFSILYRYTPMRLGKDHYPHNRSHNNNIITDSPSTLPRLYRQRALAY